MTTMLTATCRCGKSASIPCPTIADIPTAWDEGFPGWGHDERGRVRCPTCLEAGDAPPDAAALIADHGPLFAGGSA